MIPPSLESTSCSSAGIFEPVPPSVLSWGNAPLLPFVSAFSGKQPRGSSFDRLVPDLPPDVFIKHALSVAVHPMARPCPLPTRLVDTIVTAAKLADNLVAQRWSLFQIVLRYIMYSLLRAKVKEHVSLAIRLLYLGVGFFPFFPTFNGRSWIGGQTFFARLSCLPLIGLAPVSGVLSPKSVPQPFLCPNFGQRFLNVMLKCSIALVPPVTPSWIVAQVKKQWTDLTLP